MPGDPEKATDSCSYYSVRLGIRRSRSFGQVQVGDRALERLRRQADGLGQRRVRVDAQGDIGLTLHPHPTLSETVAMAAEAFEGTITDLYLPRRP